MKTKKKKKRKGKSIVVFFLHFSFCNWIIEKICGEKELGIVALYGANIFFVNLPSTRHWYTSIYLFAAVVLVPFSFIQFACFFQLPKKLTTTWIISIDQQQFLFIVTKPPKVSLIFQLQFLFPQLPCVFFFFFLSFVFIYFFIV